LPQTLDELVPEFFESVPLDPCDRSGGQLRYQVASPSEAVVWSVGQTGFDDGGDVEASFRSTNDLGFSIKTSKSLK